MSLRKEYTLRIAKILLISFIIQLCVPVMSFASVETSGLMPQRTIVTASGAATPATTATSATTSTPEMSADSATTSTPETSADHASTATTEKAKTPATASTQETFVAPATSSKPEAPATPATSSEPETPATPATPATASTASESVSGNKLGKTNETQQAESGSSTKSKTSFGSSGSSGSHSSGSSSGSHSNASSYYGDVVQVISAAPIQAETVSKPPAIQNAESQTSSALKKQNPVRTNESKTIEKETSDIKESEADTSDESNVKIINPKHETTFDELFGTDKEAIEELTEDEEETHDNAASLSKKILIIIGASLGAVALTGTGIYLFSKKN